MLRILIFTLGLICLASGGLLTYAPPSPLNPELTANCALIISSPKRRTSFDYGSDQNLQYIANYVPSIKVSAAIGYGKVCITYDDINQAVIEAKAQLNHEVPQEIYELSSDLPMPEHIEVAAIIVQETTRILANKFGLSTNAVLHGLPRIDTTKTIVKDICPTFLRPVKCEISRYRTLTGMCNNLENPSWGSTRSVMIRFLPPVYGDGISTPRESVTGEGLPNPRLVSFVVHQDISEHHRQVRFVAVAWGQMIDHDLTLAAPTLDHERQDIECCKYAVQDRHPNCMPIDIPANDPFYKFFNRRCLDFARLLPGLKPGCSLGPRGQQNTLSSFVDAGFVYGSTQDVASRLRAFQGGRLKSLNLWKDIGMKELLPMKTVEADVGCMARPRNVYCFDAGDERVNEQLALTVMHTIWMREHNRVADVLAQINQHWDDETVYQEARHIVIAEVQHITFNEFLPMILGHDHMTRYELLLTQDGYYNGYNAKVNAGIRTAFQAAVFRFGHSLLPDVTERFSKYHEKLEAIRLSQLIRQPYDLYKPGIVDSFIMGLINQQANRMDPEVTTEVTNHLFEKPGDRFGMDLASLNLQRAREVGLPGYNFYREYCGQPKARDFWDLIGVMPNKTVYRYSQLYKHVDDIDLWSAGISEYPLEGGALGPTFACLISEQFANIRRGDRFWYENPGWPSSFTPEQLTELRKVRLCRVLCDNSDDMLDIQVHAMLLHHDQDNPRVMCDDHGLPHPDLSKWKDLNYHKKK